MNNVSKVDALEVIRGLIRISAHLSARTPISTRMELLCEETCAVLKCDRSSILLWDGEYYRAAYNWGNPPDLVELFPMVRIRPDDPVVRQMERTRTYVLINNARQHPHTAKFAGLAGIESIVIAPMYDSAGDRLGLMTGEFNERMETFDEEQAEIVLGAARLAQGTIITESERSRRRRAGEGQRKLLEQLLFAEDRERQRLSAEIHDDPLQRLIALQHSLDVLASETADDRQASRITEVADQTALVAKSLRDVIRDVHPLAIELGGLADATRSQLERARTRTGWTVEFVDDLDGEPSATVAAVLFRIAQQALRNCERHANASSVRLVIGSTDGGTTVIVSDDGSGFDPTTVPEGRFGLITMAERAEHAGGRLTVDSEPGAGTVVTVWLPDQA